MVRCRFVGWLFAGIVASAGIASAQQPVSLTVTESDDGYVCALSGGAAGAAFALVGSISREGSQVPGGARVRIGMLSGAENVLHAGRLDGRGEARAVFRLERDVLAWPYFVQALLVSDEKPHPVIGTSALWRIRAGESPRVVFDRPRVWRWLALALGLVLGAIGVRSTSARPVVARAWPIVALAPAAFAVGTTLAGDSGVEATRTRINAPLVRVVGELERALATVPEDAVIVCSASAWAGIRSLRHRLRYRLYPRTILGPADAVGRGRRPTHRLDRPKAPPSTEHARLANGFVLQRSSE